jgi:CubicO group peptidase (beta-lactamase class C family)
VLLLADLVRTGELDLADLLHERLPPVESRHPAAYLITLRHLATHTSGLPRVPLPLVPGALLHPYRNGYARYGARELLDAFARARPHPCPGTRWRYSNFGVALLALAMSHTAGASYPRLLTDRVLEPLGLTGGVALAPGGPGRDAVGHRSDGRTPLPAAELGSFTPAGAVRATPRALLRWLEAHLDPDGTGPGGRGSGTLAGPLREVRRPVLRRGLQHRHVHTLTWFLHPGPGGPLLFHAGATFGQQSFLGFHPASGTGVVALATRHDRASRLVAAGYGLLAQLAADPAPAAPDRVLPG